MKKLSAIVLIIVLTLSMAACAKDDGPGTVTTPITTSPSIETTSPALTTPTVTTTSPAATSPTPGTKTP